jgi:hypothetical protein
MMKLLCFVFLVGLLAIECEAWGPRIRLPRVRIRMPSVRVPSPRLRVPRLRVPRLRVPRLRAPRLRVPRLRVPRLRVPRLRVPRLRLPRLRVPRLRLHRLRLRGVRLRKIYNKAKDRFRSLYKKICGANEKRKDCGVDLVSRKRKVCFTKYLCLVKYVKKILGKRSIDSQDFNKGKYSFKATMA